MEIREILKRTQPELYEKLNKRDRNNKRSSKKRKQNKGNLNEKDINELMSHSSYRRYSGAIRQIK
ncbi:hypothetical protein [uncultured Clostridium sp.]|jgi:hypothetical protein|uniref:hypothetical protein n=1 Tax=uncultured Clostridium sp. TaxID=59620 RepID=UPI00280AD6A3|nr:hypothetical protein [uncultured Clostridium sp.]